MGQSVSLAWDRDDSHTNLSAFIVKYGASSGSYTGQVSVATNVTSATVSNLAAGRIYYFAVTARSTAGLESDPSNEVVTNTPNQPPVAVAASVSTAEDQSVAITLGGTDPDGSPLTYSVVTTPANGTLSGTAPSLSYIPAANFSGADSFTFRVSDGLSNSSPATISIVVNQVNDTPTLTALSNLSITEDAGQQTVGLAGIGSGAGNESQTLTITASSSNTGLIPNPAVSYISPNSTGTLTFTPVANAIGSATITVTVNDGQSLNNTVTRTLTVTVNAVNDAPVLNAIGNLTINEDATAQTVGLAGIGSGAANESQTLTVTAASSNTSLVPNPTVSYTSPNATGTLTFTPVASASGTATITVTVNDGQSQNNTFTRTFTVTINAVNDTPTLNALGNLTINEDASQQSVSLAGIGSGAANESQALTITASSSNTGLIPTPTVSYSSPNATGTLTFTPVANANGTATITVTVNDGQSQNNTFARTFTVTLNAVNDAPTLNSLANLPLSEDAPTQTVNLAGISSGGGNESQTLSVTATSSNPTLVPNPTVSYASPSATGSLTLKSAANATGTATITVTVNDGQALNNTVTRTFTVTVNGVNDAPTISDITDQSISQNGATALLPFTIGDVETSASSLTVAATSSSPTLVPAANIVFGGTGANRTVKVTPALNQFGSAAVNLTVSDGAGGIASDSFVVTVTAGNQPPTLDALNDLTIVEDAGVQTVALTGIGSGSINENQTLSITVVSSNPSLIPNPTLTYTSPNATGSISFTPVANAHGTATITVVVNDGQSQNNAVAETFVVTVNSVNDAPTLNPIANVSLTQGAGLQSVALSGIGTGAANENQSLSISAVSSNPSLIPNPTVNYFTPNATGTLGFTPATGVIGTATITVTVDDGQSLNNTAVRTFTVTVGGSNQPPSITDVADLSIPANSPAISIQMLVGDVETLAINLQMRVTSSNPSLVSTNNITLSNAGSNRVANITPLLNQAGVTIITFTVTDTDGGSASDSFVLTVVAPNARPSLDPLPDLVLNEDSGLRTVNLTGVSDGSTNENQPLIVSAVSDNPAVIPHPVVNYTYPDTSGTLAVTPATNASGSAYITVTINDGQNQNNLLVRTFRVWVNAVNDAPTISPVPNQLVENNTATATLPFVIHDTETSVTSLGVSASSSNPTLVPNANIALGGSGANRTIKVTPAALQSGTAAISIFVTDGALTAAGSFLVTVGATNTAPAIEAPASLSTDSYTPLPNVPIVVADKESRPEDLVLTVTSFNQTVLPSTNITISGTGSNRTVSLKPVTGKSGEVSLSFSLTDGRLLTRASCQLMVQLGTAPKSKLSVRRKGRGTVQPALDGVDLTIGQSYTLTAVPASDEVFVSWSGAVTSSVPAVTFVMASNMVVEAGFTNSPYLPMKGAYNGLFYEVAEVKQKSSGSFAITASERGTYTGKLKLGSKTYPLSGKIDLQCKATNTIVRSGYSTVAVEFDFGRATNQVVGRVTDTLWEAPLLGDRSCYNSKTNAAPFAGSYTLIVPGQDDPDAGPEGDGFGAVKVDANGLATLAGTLADGTKFSQKVPLSRSGQWPLYVPLYSGTGSILSWMTVTNRVTDDVNGLLSWIKPAQAKAKQYAGGFTNETFVVGSLYVRPASTTNRVLNLSQADVLFGGGNLESEWTNPVLWSPQNKITNLGDNKLTMTVSLTTGLFSGSAVDPSTGKPVKFSGALLQKFNAGSGFSLGTNRSARVVVQE